jgi:hypothetical protein
MEDMPTLDTIQKLADYYAPADLKYALVGIGGQVEFFGFNAVS